jgi:serine/threonine-protein kinase
MTEKPTRQLAAIMFADMVGYTALMQEDEGRAREERDRHRALLTTAVERYNGEILQHYGDGTLSIFTSAVEAVECAIEVQVVLSRASASPLRIGVHTGDIVHDQDGVYGDGVNVASRIEGLSAPGGVMVSGKVYDEIKNHPSISVVPIGAVRLKNVEHFVTVFAISNEGLGVPTLEEVGEKAGSEVVPPGTGDADPSSVAAGAPPGAGEAFLKRAKDRALFQWAAAYLAGAWAVLEVVGFAGDRLLWPSLIPQAAAVVAFFGFFVALVVTWYHGERGRQRVHGREVLLIALLLVIAGAVLSTLSTEGPPASTVGSGLGVTSARVDNRPSVAALPWVNRSGREEDAYFTDGIHDEILTRLTKIRGLRIISRRSVMHFRDSPLTSREIADELDVRYILEAGLIRVRDTIRLNVQLTDASTDDQIWADTYDRFMSLENLLSLQSEIAQTIADTLQAAVSPEEEAGLNEVSASNMEAYDFYLQGRRYYLRPGYNRENLQAAQNLFERAIALDPDFAKAHAFLSRVHGVMFWESFDPSPERLESQKAAAEEALRLDPELPQAHMAAGWVHYVEGDFAEALADYHRALECMPNDAEIIARIGYAHRRLGNWPQVFEAYEEAVRLNPRDATLFYDLGGHSFTARRRYAEAVEAYERAETLAPDLYDAAISRGNIYLRWQGQLDTLQAVMARIPEDLHLPEVDVARVNLALFQRDANRVFELLATHPATVFATQLLYLPKQIYAGWAYAMLGDESAAGAAFDSARVILEPLVEERHNEARLHVALGYAYAGLGRSSDAILSAQRYRASLPGTQNALSAPRPCTSFAWIPSTIPSGTIHDSRSCWSATGADACPAPCLLMKRS